MMNLTLMSSERSERRYITPGEEESRLPFAHDWTDYILFQDSYHRSSERGYYGPRVLYVTFFLTQNWEFRLGCPENGILRGIQRRSHS